MLDLSKPVQYRNGEGCRILCNDRHGNRPIVSMNGIGMLIEHYNDGSYREFSESPYDIVNIPVVPADYWLVIYAFCEHAMIYDEEPFLPHGLPDNTKLIHVREVE